MNLIQIENRAGKLRLNDGVHKESADKLIEELDSLYGASAVAAQMKIGDVFCKADDALESVEVEINSPGGSVFEGRRIYNALRGISARGVEVVTTVNGLAASMGSVILMAGDKKQMTHGSRIMIHEASTIAWGDARTMRKNADLLEGISSEIAGIYADRTGGNEKKIRNLMFAETWMTADEAKENGFVDTVLKDGKEKAKLDIGNTEVKSSLMSILAKLFPGNDDALKIEAAILENDSLRADLTDAQAKIDELSGLSAVIADKDAELHNLGVSFASITAELETIKAELEASKTEIETVKASVAAEAVAIVAAFGQPETIGIDESTQSQKLNLESFNKLTPAARMEYIKSGNKITE